MTTQIQVCIRLLALSLAVACSMPARAEIPDPPEPTEQLVQASESQAQWVQRFQQASSLLTAGKTQDALKVLQSLQANLPDLDTQGLVAVAIGDCQFNLQQYEQARQTYLQAQAAHPELADHLWVRLTEVDVVTGKTTAAQTTLQQIMAGTGSSDTKSWAALRLATVQERQAIQALQQAQEAYTKANQARTEGVSGIGWALAHAEDLKDAVQQLQTALRQLDRNAQWLSVTPDQRSMNMSMVQGLKVAKAQLGGTIHRIFDKDSVELTIDKDGKVEATLGGKNVQIDAATQRQIKRHVEQALRLVAQEDK